MDSKMKRGMSFIRNLFIYICLFITIIGLAKAVGLLVRKIYAYIPGTHRPRRTSENVASRRLKKTAKEKKKTLTYKERKASDASISYESRRVKNTGRTIYIQPPPVEELTLRNTISTHAPGRGVHQVLSGINVERELISGHTIPEYDWDFSVWERRRKRKLHFVRIVNAVVNALLFVPQKIYAYVRRKLEELEDSYLDNMADLAYMEPVVILKGEEPADSIDLKNITVNSETVDSGNQRQEQNGKVPVLLRLRRELFGRIQSAMTFLSSHFTALFGDRDKKQNGKVPAGVGLRRSIRELVCRSTRALSFLCSHFTTHFWVRDKKQNGKIPAGIGLPRLFRELFRRSTSVMPFLYSHLTTRFRDRDKKQVQQTTSQEIRRSTANVSRERNERKVSSVSRWHQAVKGETVAAHSRLPVKSSPPYQVTSERVLPYLWSLCSDTVNRPASPNTGRGTESQRLSYSRHSLVEKERLKASPTAGQRAEKHVTFTSEVKVNGKIIPSSTLHSKVDSAARASVDGSKAEKKKAMVEEKPPVHVDIPAPTPPVKRNPWTRPAPVDPQVRANTSSGVADSSQDRSANVGSDTHGTSSAKEQVDTELTSPRRKRAKNEEDCEQLLRPWDVPTPIDRTQNSLPGSKSKKRKAVSGGVVLAKPKPTGCVASKRHRVDMQTSQAVTADQVELMEVRESPPEIPFPESMEIGGEENAVIFLERDEVVPIDIDPQPDAVEPMETNQDAVSQGFFSGLWGNIIQPFCVQPFSFLQSFFVQPAQEMETDELPLPTTPSIEVTERSQQPFTIAMPFGQLSGAWWPVATAMGRSEATATEPEQESMETNQQLIDACQPVASPFWELQDARKPSQSVAEVRKEASLFVETLNAAEQAIMQPVVPAELVLTKRTTPPLLGAMAQCAIQPDTSVCNQQPHGATEWKVNNGQNLATIEQKRSVAAEPGPSVYNEHSQKPECNFNDGALFTGLELQQLALDDESGAVCNQKSQEATCNFNDGQRFTAIELQQLALDDESGEVYNDQPPEASCNSNDGHRFSAIELQQLALDDESDAVYNEPELNNGQSFVTVTYISEEQLLEDAELHPHSINQETMERLQIVPPEGGNVPDGVDSDSGDDYGPPDVDSDDDFVLDEATMEQYSTVRLEPEHEELLHRIMTKHELQKATE
ncbi:hypothetical protein OS493_018661 [Desmophyllum pertusum]|uniref:Uncharacterized protein n=1 Tax=Desmophyllum pertusum TaxID=174260 RepID=A0A9X0D2N1_9CNID|nr:hypothetical protein OS493_018661 [Desmophyllum pertusum]